jgi:hypothetical protein
LPDINSTLHQQANGGKLIYNKDGSIRKPGGRPNGAKSSYTVTPAVMQRIYASLPQNRTKFIEKVIATQGLTPEETKQLSDLRMDLWKTLGSPTLLLMTEYTDLKTLIMAKQMKGGEILGADILQASKLLLDISKEMNRLTTLSAKDKADLATHAFDIVNPDKDIVFDVTPNKDEVVSDEHD